MFRPIPDKAQRETDPEFYSPRNGFDLPPSRPRYVVVEPARMKCPGCFQIVLVGEMFDNRCQNCQQPPTHRLIRWHDLR